jgi:hypothetical protein
MMSTFARIDATSAASCATPDGSGMTARIYETHRRSTATAMVTNGANWLFNSPATCTTEPGEGFLERT